MKSKLHVLYITGLGDGDPSRQRTVIKAWRWWGVEPELFQSNWSSGEPWTKKFQRLLQRIDELTVQDKVVGLVGVSAGASAAINAYAARKGAIAGVVLLAGKLNHPEAVGEPYRREAPSFIHSLAQCQKALASLSATDRSKILSRYAFYDEIVPKRDSIVSGAVNKVRYLPGHVPLIASQISFGAPSLLRFLKKQAKIARY